MALPKDPITFCMVGTPFTKENKVDEPALRATLRRMVAANNGVYLCSGGAGEGHVLTTEEHKLIYKIGIEECKGKVPTYANPREPRSAAAMLEIAGLAVKAGVEVVQCYPLDGGHGMRPTLLEQELYYREFLDNIKHPTAISIHAAVGYVAPVALIAKMVKEYKQVVALNVMGPPMSYLQELMDANTRKVDYYVPIMYVMQGMGMGARGVMEAESNLAPRLCRQVMDELLRNDYAAAGETYTNLTRLASIVNRWAPSTARWVKMGWKVLDLPGGNGVLREPYRMPPQAELDQMSAMFEKMGLRRLEGLDGRSRAKARR